MLINSDSILVLPKSMLSFSLFIVFLAIKQIRLIHLLSAEIRASYTPALADSLRRPVSKTLGPGHHQVLTPSKDILLHADGIVEDHCLAIIARELLPLVFAGGWVAPPVEIGPHLL